jgi:tetratricopeptide (TPR) repeat protein
MNGLQSIFLPLFKTIARLFEPMTQRNIMNKYLQQLSVLVSAVGLLVGSAMAQGTMRNEVIKPLAAAQEAIKSNQNEQALGLLRDALAVPQLTANEKNMILRTQAVAALRAQKWAIAVEALESLVTSADVAQADKPPLLESLINACLQTKDDARVVKWSRQYFQVGGANPAVHLAMVQSLVASGQHTEVVTVMLGKARLDASTGKKTPELELRAWALSYRQLKDDAGYMNTLKQLLSSYPSKAYWAEVIGRMSQQAGLNTRLELDLYRLLEETDNLEDAAEYMEMASLALKAGLPTEAVRVLTKGFDVGVLGKAEAVAHAKLRTDAQKKVREDDALFVQLEKSAKDGPSWAAVGDVHFSRQNWSAAHLAYAKAIESGGLRREHEVRLHDAISLVHAQQKVAARQQLALVSGDATAVELAALWTILAR